MSQLTLVAVAIFGYIFYVMNKRRAPRRIAPENREGYFFPDDHKQDTMLTKRASLQGRSQNGDSNAQAELFKIYDAEDLPFTE